jgi:hypothetical protein
VGAFDTIARVLQGGKIPRSVRGYIIPIASDDKRGTDDDIRCLQYFPETISDTKGNGWQPKDIPGLSHPLYQWVSGGPRDISFTAIFSRDNELATNPDATIGLGTLDIAANVTANDLRNVDIPGAVAWLRQFMMPTYTVNGAKAERSLPPKRLVLVLPGVRMNHTNPAFGANEVPCIMTQCDVVYQAFFPSGTPRLTAVTLAFAETIQLDGGVSPQDSQQAEFVGKQLYRFNPTKKKI